jgi:phage-related holin
MKSQVYSLVTYTGNGPSSNNKSFLGFESMSDFIGSLFRFKYWSLNSSIAFVGALTTFITGYMWDTASAVYTLWALMGADWLTGIFKSMKKGVFNSYRFWRMPIYFVATSFILSISWWISKSSTLFFFLPSIVMAGFYGVYLTSLLENCGELELLPKSLVRLLNSKFGLQALIKKITSDENS